MGRLRRRTTEERGRELEQEVSRLIRQRVEVDHLQFLQAFASPNASHVPQGPERGRRDSGSRHDSQRPHPVRGRPTSSSRARQEESPGHAPQIQPPVAGSWESFPWTLDATKASIKRKGIIPLCPDNGHWTVWLKNKEEYAGLVGAPLALPLGSDPGRWECWWTTRKAWSPSMTQICSFTEKLLPFFSPGVCDDGVLGPFVHFQRH